MIADSSGRMQSTAPVPRGTEPLSRVENAPTNADFIDMLAAYIKNMN